jgi:NSS family neurotransmitter:Na+ symporter
VPAVLGLTAVIWVLGLGTVLSFNVWQDWYWLGSMNFFQLLEAVTADFLLPVVSLLIAIFVGWRMREELLRLELVRESALFFSLWLVLLRYIVPPAIGVILLVALVSN